MVAVEVAATISGDDSGQAETQPPEPVLPGANQRAETTGARSSWRPREGNHYRTFFSITPATGQAATSDSRSSGEVLCSASVLTGAGMRWRGSPSARQRCVCRAAAEWDRPA